jgi:phosphoenolpyruvate---glycerone phosphotransferase subunit DhaL
MSSRIAGDDGAASEAGVAGADQFTTEDLRAWVVRAERILVRHRALLDRLDARLGDGDHGENMSVGFADAVRAMRGDRDGRDAGELLRDLGQLVVASVGGAGGSLYGTALIEAGIAVVGKSALDASDLATALDAAAEGLARRGRCRLGDKTIYDALRPAADAVAEAVREGRGVEAALRAAAGAARAGMIATRPLIARRGLALRLGERSRGHQDPGATSCFLLLRAMLPASGPA